MVALAEHFAPAGKCPKLGFHHPNTTGTELPVQGGCIQAHCELRKCL